MAPRCSTCDAGPVACGAAPEVQARGQRASYRCVNEGLEFTDSAGDLRAVGLELQVCIPEDLIALEGLESSRGRRGHVRMNSSHFHIFLPFLHKEGKRG